LSSQAACKVICSEGLLILAAHVTPHVAFTAGIVFPYTAPVLTAWFCVSAAASYMHFFVRRQLRDAERDKARYLEAIHMVSHEMRSPLTAIQGTSELMGRYTLSDDKRQTDGPDDQLGIEAPGPDDPDVLGCRTSIRR